MKGLFKKTFFGVLLSAVLIFGMALSAFAAEATVNDDGTRVRSDSSTSSDVVTVASKGTTYTVTDSVTGSDGNTWYKVDVNGTTGYIRSDLVSVSGDAGDASPSEVTSSAPATAINPITATTTDTANIRSGAGTDYSKVGTIENGTEVTLTGIATASDGVTWYQMECASKNISGYIRNDFVNVSEADITYPGNDLGEGTEGDGEYYSDDIESEEYVDDTHNDYEIVYTTDSDGVYQYYLYNHIDNTKQKVEDLLEAVNSLNDKYKKTSSQLSTFKILTILFGALMIVAIILAVFFFLRSRNVEYEYYEDDFEEDEPPVKKAPQEKERQRKPAAERQSAEGGERPKRSSEERSRARDDSGEARQRPERERRESPDREKSAERAERAERSERTGERTGERSEAQREVRKPRRPQNFLADDDEFEFEFLNMDE